jgi:predicted NAD/FAD-dependent oxidoreductase
MSTIDRNRVQGAEPPVPEATDVLIVGAGMAGLAAASVLCATDHCVVVVEKSRGVGNRLATRRIGEATLDFGAQFMTARDPRFKSAIDGWCASGVVRVWDWSTPEHPDRHLRWRGRPAMTGLPKHLARGKQAAR